jgi:hypothetical protein
MNISGAVNVSGPVDISGILNMHLHSIINVPTPLERLDAVQ